MSLRRGAAERLLDGARRVGAPAPDERRPARRDAERRARLEPDRRPDGPAHERAGEDVLGRLRRSRRRQRARRRAAASPSTSAPTTTSSSCRSPSETVDLAELVWHMDEPLADLSSLGFLALSELAASRASRSRSPARAPTSCSAAIASTGPPRSRRRWQRLPGPLRAAASRRAAACGPRGSVAPARTLAAPDPAERLLAMSGNLDDGLRRELAARAARGARRRRGAARSLASGSATSATTRSPRRCTSTASSASSTTCSTTSTARRWRTRSRCACRSSTTTSSSSARRSRRGSRCGGWTTKHVLKHAARGLVPDRIIDKPKVGFFNAAVDGWFRAQTAAARSRDYLLGPEPALRRVPRPRRRRGARRRARRRHARRATRYLAALDPDARGLALLVPSARARTGAARSASPSRRDREADQYAVVTPVAERGGESRRLADCARANRRLCPSSWVIVDNGSTDETPGGRRAARRGAQLDCRRPRLRGRRVGAARGASDRAGLRARTVDALSDAVRTSSSSSMPTSRSARTTSSGSLRGSPPTRRSGSPAAAATSCSDGEWARTPRHRDDRLGRLARVPVGRASSRCSRSSSGWAGTASTSSRRTPGWNNERPSRTSRSGITVAKASGTAAA